MKHGARRPTPRAQLNKTLAAWGPAQEMYWKMETCLGSFLLRSISSSFTPHPSPGSRPAPQSRAATLWHSSCEASRAGFGQDSCPLLASQPDHAQCPSRLARAKISLPSSTCLQMEKEPSNSSSRTHFKLNLVSSHQPHTAAGMALTAAFLNLSFCTGQVYPRGISPHPMPLTAKLVQKRPPGPKISVLTPSEVML